MERPALALLEALEADGRFSDILQVESGSIDKNRFLAAKARALAFLERRDEARSTIEILESQNLDAASACVTSLARAVLLRQDELWDAATIEAQSAHRLALQIDHAQLIADSLFAVAFSIREQGQIIESMRAFESIWRDTSVSRYRRDWAVANLAWVYWDLGRTDEMENLIPSLPKQIVPRATLMLAVARVEVDEILRRVRAFDVFAKLPWSERLMAAVVASEAIAVLNLDQQLKPEELTSLLAILRDCLNKSPATASVAQAALALLGERVENPIAEEGLPWRSLLSLRFLCWLKAIKDGSSLESSLERYQQTMLPILEEYHLNTVLMPKLRNGRFYGADEWSGRLQEFASQMPRKEMSSKVSTSGRVGYGEGRLVYVAGPGVPARTIDFRGSPISRRALELLSGSRGRIISKKEFHSQLTSSRYHPELHNQRLYQLLSRLRDKTLQHGFPVLFELPGDNCIHVVVDIHKSAGDTKS